MAIYITNSTANNYGITVYQPGAFVQHVTGNLSAQPDYSGDNSQYTTKYQSYGGPNEVLDAFDYSNIYETSNSFSQASGIFYSSTGTDNTNFLSEVDDDYSGGELDVSLRWSTTGTSEDSAVFGVQVTPYISTIPSGIAPTGTSDSSYSLVTSPKTDTDSYNTARITIPTSSLTGLSGGQKFVLNVARFSQDANDDLVETAFIRYVNIYTSNNNS